MLTLEVRTVTQAAEEQLLKHLSTELETNGGMIVFDEFVNLIRKVSPSFTAHEREASGEEGHFTYESLSF
jgi:hypothetical protein